MSMAPYEIQKLGLAKHNESIKGIQTLSASEKPLSKTSPAFFQKADKSAGEDIKAPAACRENLFANTHSLFKRTSFPHNDAATTQKLEDKPALSKNETGYYFLHGVLVGTPPDLFNRTPK